MDLGNQITTVKGLFDPQVENHSSKICFLDICERDRQCFSNAGLHMEFKDGVGVEGGDSEVSDTGGSNGAPAYCHLLAAEGDRRV